MHKVAISNHRLVSNENGKVSFRWKDYRKSKDGEGNTSSIMELDAHEFIRRFLLHVLPRGFVRIRHYGILANRQRGTKLAKCRELLGVADRAPEAELDWEAFYAKLTGHSIRSCRECQHGQMAKVEIIPSFQELLQQLNLGVYLPALRLSRAMAAAFVRKLHHIMDGSPSPAANGTKPQVPQRLDS